MIELQIGTILTVDRTECEIIYDPFDGGCGNCILRQNKLMCNLFNCHSRLRTDGKSIIVEPIRLEGKSVIF